MFNVKPEVAEKLGVLTGVLADVQRLVHRLLTNEDCQWSPAEQALLDAVLEVHGKCQKALQAPVLQGVEKSEEEEIADLLADWQRIYTAFKNQGFEFGIKERSPENWKYIFRGEWIVADNNDGTGYLFYAPSMAVRLSPDFQNFFDVEEDTFKSKNEQSRSFEIVRPAKIKLDSHLIRHGADAEVTSANSFLKNVLIKKGLLKRKPGKEGKSL